MGELSGGVLKSQGRTGSKGAIHGWEFFTKAETNIMDRRTAVSYILASALGAFAQAAEPIKIGVTAPLTGPNAESGRYQIQAANLAVDEINKAGGVLGRPLNS